MIEVHIDKAGFIIFIHQYLGELQLNLSHSQPSFFNPQRRLVNRGRP